MPYCTLDLSEMQAGQLDLACIPFSLRDSLGIAMKTLTLRAHDKGLEVAYHVYPDGPDAPTALSTPVPSVAHTPLVTSDLTRERRQCLKIFVAEDNTVNQQLAVRMLEKQGHMITAVAIGKAAVAALVQQPYDVVLMDVQMPEMDGLEATAAIHAHERAHGGHMPMIAMTAHAMRGNHERCPAAGMDGYVTKPMLEETLDTKDMTRLASLAHTLKGVVGSLAAQAASAAAQRLEQLAWAGDLALAPAASATLAGEMVRLIPVLTSLAKEATP
jgi:CheY-like chemotaxis protein